MQGHRAWKAPPRKLPFSVQACLEAAAGPLAGSAFVRAGSSPALPAASVVAAGRTDAGVHAIGQVCHVDLDRKDASVVLRAVNARLGRMPVRVTAVECVDDSFHARFSASAREYWYLVWASTKRMDAPVHTRDRLWFVDGTSRLDVAAMQLAAASLVGRHDFVSFSASSPSTRDMVTVRDLLACDVVPLNDDGAMNRAPAGLLAGLGALDPAADTVVGLRFRASGFLYHQVRKMTEVLVRVGRGQLAAGDVASIRDARDRSVLNARLAPAHGLYFTDVSYGTPTWTAPAAACWPPATPERTSLQ